MSKTDDENESRKLKKVVYYIALTASDRCGKPRKEYCTFDIASRMDLADTKVHVLDCHDLKEMYRKRHGDKAAEKADVYNLVEVLIDSNEREEGGLYFVDECPFLQMGGSKSLCIFILLWSFSLIFFHKSSHWLLNRSLLNRILSVFSYSFLSSQPPSLGRHFFR